MSNFFKTPALLFLIATINACGLASTGKTSSSKSSAMDQGLAFVEGKAIVNKRSVLFSFKLTHPTTYEWDKTAKGKLEWEWRAIAELNGKSYAIGFNRRSLGGNANSGALADLLAAGHINVRFDSDEKQKEGDLVSDEVDADISGDNLILDVSYAEIVDLFNKDKPEKVIFRAKGELQSPKFEVPIAVQYK